MRCSLQVQQVAPSMLLRGCCFLRRQAIVWFVQQQRPPATISRATSMQRSPSQPPRVPRVECVRSVTPVLVAAKCSMCMRVARLIVVSHLLRHANILRLRPVAGIPVLIQPNCGRLLLTNHLISPQLRIILRPTTTPWESVLAIKTQ